MSILKKVWITEYDGGLASLTVESACAVDKWQRVKYYENVFPELPSKNNPLRHTIVLRLFNDEDLKMIMVTIAKYLQYSIEE